MSAPVTPAVSRLRGPLADVVIFAELSACVMEPEPDAVILTPLAPVTLELEFITIAPAVPLLIVRLNVLPRLVPARLTWEAASFIYTAPLEVELAVNVVLDAIAMLVVCVPIPPEPAVIWIWLAVMLVEAACVIEPVPPVVRLMFAAPALMPLIAIFPP